ncbi:MULTISPECIES: hypothetical protein [Amycolatopsis]|uniref:Uncharacterized protein n=1 Tax=Amycolatopsis bullii TaxID=941987 RepID=A0ABQ3KC27_9PSEU|nr:hypothetical protein [Amycolatopsis bullii]GHG11108.1 hypothetical protein GCM10017567_30430 [Amycolatopsis bullii]
MILTDERWQELLHVRATNPVPTRQACADAVTELAAYGLVTLIELPEALDATTLPVLLGGLPPDWTLSHGVVRGLVMNPAGNVEAAAKALEAAK